MIRITPLKKAVCNMAILIVIATTITACGFHLRGNIPLPDGIKNMYILAPEGTFEETLKDSLTRLGAQVASNKADADVVLHITKAVTTREVGTLDERGKASSYNLILNVDYELKDPAGEEIRSAKLKEKVRYDYNPDLVIESESEERDLTEDLEQEVALRIVRQLSTVTDYPPATQQ